MNASILLPLAEGGPVTQWLPVALLLVMGIGFAVVNIVLSILIGPRRQGSVKEMVYESGMTPIGDPAQRRFNVRFYIVAMIFLVFDVTLVFLYPWATAFPGEVARDTPAAFGLLMSLIVFIAILLVAYLYAWGKGVFRWD